MSRNPTPQNGPLADQPLKGVRRFIITPLLGTLPILLMATLAPLAVYASNPHPWPGMSMQTSVRLDGADANSLNTKIK